MNDETKEKDETAVEEWMKTDEGDKPEGVPTATHIRIKEKLKTRVAEKDSEIEALKQKIAVLEQGVQRKAQPHKEPLERPKRVDFGNDDAYYEAIDVYQDRMLEDRYARLNAQQTQKSRQKRAMQTVEQSVDAHYERAAKLLEETGISDELYKNADISVRKAVSDVLGTGGDAITDQLIATIGEGSEKVLYYVGNNRTALDRFRSLLSSDPTGLQAAMFLGEQKNRLNKPGRMQSTAPAPSRELPGGDVPVVGAGELQKRYNTAVKKGDINGQINAKLDARRNGVDTSAW